MTHTRLTDVNESVWSYFERHNAWYSYTSEMPTLKWLAELDGAGSSSKDRMIVAVNDRRVMEMAMSIPPRVLTTLNKGYTICSPIEYKISGQGLPARPPSVWPNCRTRCLPTKPSQVQIIKSANESPWGSRCDG